MKRFRIGYLRSYEVGWGVYIFFGFSREEMCFFSLERGKGFRSFFCSRDIMYVCLRWRRMGGYCFGSLRVFKELYLF